MTPPSSDASPDLGSRAQALLDAVIAISSDLDLTSVLTRIIEAAASLTDARYGALGVMGSDGELIEFITTGVEADVRASIGELPKGRGILGVISENSEPLRLDDLATHPASVGFPPNHPPMRSFLGMPVRTRGTIFGNIYLTEKEGGGPFTEADEHLVEQLARTAGFVVANAHAYGMSERRRQWLEASADIAEALQAPSQMDAALDEIARTALEVSRGRAVSLWSSSGVSADVVRVAPGVEKAEKEGVEAALARVRERTTLVPGGPVLTTRVDGAPVVVVPLRTHLAPTQALVVLGDPESPLLDIEERELFAGFADQVAFSLDRAAALGDRQELAVISDRERIARDLHDIVIQRLFATGLQLQGIAAMSKDRAVAERIDAAVSELDLTIKAIRGTIFELQDRTGDSLRAEIRSLVKGYVPILGFTPAVRTSGPIDTAVSPELGTQLLAVLREAISNVARHALADSAQVDLVVNDDRLEMRVADDGVGIPDEVSESGLRNARRRAVDLGGSLDISRVGARGSVLVWRVPLS